jgi:uncharacterized protein (TIGR03437 family)
VHRLSSVVLIALLAASVVSANAQNTVPISVSANGTADLDSASIPLTGGGGAVTPFGNATANGSSNFNYGSGSATLTLTFALANGDSFVASDPSGNVTADSGIAATVIGTATISAGTGQFAGATGSFTYTFQGGGTQATIKSWAITGSGTLTRPGSLPACAVQSNNGLLNFTALPGMLEAQAAIVLQPVQTATCAAAPVAFSASASTSDGQNWLSVAPASGMDEPPFSLTVTANATGLMPGTYKGAITVTQGTTTQSVGVILAVSASQHNLTLSQSGLQFQTAAGSVALPAQPVSVSESGSGALNYSASAQTLSGGSWLSVTPGSGTVNTAAPSTVNVAVDSSTLAAGDYYGLVQFSAMGAGNSPQAVEVALRVLPSTSSPEPLISPYGLVFVTTSGNLPAAQSVQVFNASNQTIDVIPTLTLPEGFNFVTPVANGTIPAGQSLALSVAVTGTNLPPGIYRATLNIQTSIDASSHPVAILLLVLPASDTLQMALPGMHPEATGNCMPTQLLPVFTLLGNNFQTPGGWPASLQALIVDDCGNPLTSGSVVASFSTGDPAVALNSIGNGSWAGTWQPHGTAAGQATITVNATSFTPALTGSAAISGAIVANPAVPSVSPGGVVSAASLESNAPVGIGSFISIFGSNLAPQATLAEALPLPNVLADIHVLLGGELVPLDYAGSGQINAIVPYDLQVNSTQQLIVQLNNTYSLPQAVTVGPAQPAVFSQNQSGTGPGVIVVVKPDGTQFETGPSAPASAGDALVIYCTGLGGVTPPVTAGAAASLTQLSKTDDPVKVTVGGQPATVLFAGLAPGFAGLYQVNVTVPAGIAASPNTPVVLTVAGQSSVPVTVAIQ